MTTEREIIRKTEKMIDELKSVCSTYGLGNASSEYKIITEIFLYKYLNDKFIYETKKVAKELNENSTTKEVEKYLDSLSPEQFSILTMRMGANVAKIRNSYRVSTLFNNQNSTIPEFYELFDNALIGISNDNVDIFSVKTGSKEKIKLFDTLSQYITESDKRNSFFRAMISKLVEFSFENAFSEKYDFFATIFEYLIKDYNKDFGKYAEYYTPNSIARIIAKILAPDPTQNVTLYDPAAGSGTLLLALAHQIGEENCTIYSQDISQKSNEFLRLNLILNNLVHSLGNVIHGDTLLNPAHLNKEKNGLAQFDYIVSNPPFKTDFSETRDQLADDKYKDRFFAGTPNIPKKDKDSMAIYLMFIQHILFSLKEDGKAAIVVPSGFLTDTGEIHSKIRNMIIDNKIISSVVQMPTNVFSNTNTSVSIIFINKSKNNNKVIFVDASHIGNNEKIGDSSRIVLTPDDELKITQTINNLIEINEFSKVVNYDEINENDNMLKPGLYFDINYEKLADYTNDEEISKKIFLEKQRGIVSEFSRKYSRNLFIKKFVLFEDNLNPKKETIYGAIPNNYDLIELNELIAKSVGGDWGKESPVGNYTEKVYCIRGADIPNINVNNYSGVPVRYCKKENVESKKLQDGDIIIEISGGSPIQSTGRISYIDKKMLYDFDSNVLCTNFCRILRFKDKEISRYVYDYLSLLYDRGYYFNLENNTTGIKNLLLNSFVQNIKVILPPKKEIELYYKLIDKYVTETINSIL